MAGLAAGALAEADLAAAGVAASAAAEAVSVVAALRDAGEMNLPRLFRHLMSPHWRRTYDNGGDTGIQTPDLSAASAAL